jgi:hypothetical protein
MAFLIKTKVSENKQQENKKELKEKRKRKIFGGSLLNSTKVKNFVL